MVWLRFRQKRITWLHVVQKLERGSSRVKSRLYGSKSKFFVSIPKGHPRATGQVVRVKTGRLREWHGSGLAKNGRLLECSGSEVKGQFFSLNFFYQGQVEVKGHLKVKVMTSSSQGQIHSIKLGVYLSEEQTRIYTSHNPLPTDMVRINGTSYYFHHRIKF